MIFLLQPDTEDAPNQDAPDIEDIGGSAQARPKGQLMPIKRKRDQGGDRDKDGVDLSKSWREILGPAPKAPKTKVGYQYLSRVHDDIL